MSREDRAVATLAKLLAILDATKRCSCIELIPDDCHERVWNQALAEARAIVRAAKAEKALN
jgi:hypothetical protein